MTLLIKYVKIATMSHSDTRTIYGSFEYASLPLLGIDSTVAKIDTGAYSGALHCSLIEVYKRSSDGQKILRFIPSKNHDYLTETDKYTYRYVRSSTGHRVKRYLIETEIVIRDKTYTITIGLSDRSDMQKEILIGRRFLREHNILVDTRINQELDSDIGGQDENSDSL